MSFHPYLFFSDGRCAEAFTRYQEVFGGELQMMTNADAPEGDRMPGAEPHHVMHASVQVGEGFLMGSDDPTGDGGPKVGVGVSFSAPDTATAERIFDALAEGGQVEMPMGETFWSPAHGSCVDRWGTLWMVGAPGTEPPPE